MNEKYEHMFKSSDGLALCADVGGPLGNPTVILLHGGGQTRHAWSKTSDRLIADGYRVISYDARGHGQSDWADDGDYTLPSLAADLVSIRQAVAGPVALVGASMGGMTGFYAVGEQGGHFANALILVDIALRTVAAGADKIANFMRANMDGFASLDEAAEAVSRYYPDRPKPANPGGLLKNLRTGEDGRLYWHWDPRLLQVSPTTEPPQYESLLVSVSQNVTIPTLLIHGELSDVVDTQSIEQILQLVPHTQITRVPGAGHMVVSDENNVFNDAILSFLRREFPVLPAAS
jgi:pimeloyl-ACP methyl ester carboxylesterase